MKARPTPRPQRQDPASGGYRRTRPGPRTLAATGEPLACARTPQRGYRRRQEYSESTRRQRAKRQDPANAATGETGPSPAPRRNGKEKTPDPAPGGNGRK